jgi:chorismate mutase/prephenate dehydratase
MNLKTNNKLEFNGAYMGPPSSFSHQAAIQHFGEESKLIACGSIPEVFKFTSENNNNFGVVPVENSNEGMVTHTLDMFINSKVKIAAEIFLDIHLNLLSNSKLKEITTVYTIPIAFAQCKNWFVKNMPSVKVVDTYSTARAAEIVSNQVNTAAVAGILASKMYNLKIVANSIEDYAHNMTRFFVINNNTNENITDSNSKTSILFSIKDKAGALYESLKPFRDAEINLTKIESRPSKQKAWEYYFFVDFIGYASDEKVKTALNKLINHCNFVKVLGSYPV